MVKISPPFGDIARNCFDALFAEHGLECVRHSDNEVFYQSERTSVSLGYSPARYEIGFAICLRESGATKPMCLNSDELREVCLVTEYDESLMPTNATLISDMLTRLANDVRRACGPLLDGEREVFTAIRDTLESKRRIGRDAYERAYKIEEIRSRAADAWGRKDWSEACRLYEAIQAELTPLEKKRLSYASKRGRAI